MNQSLIRKGGTRAPEGTITIFPLSLWFFHVDGFQHPVTPPTVKSESPSPSSTYKIIYGRNLTKNYFLLPTREFR